MLKQALPKFSNKSTFKQLQQQYLYRIQDEIGTKKIHIFYCWITMKNIEDHNKEKFSKIYCCHKQALFLKKV